MIFGFGRRQEEDDDDEEEEEIELIQFLGPMNGKAMDLATHRRLVDAGLIRAKELVSDAVSRRAGEIRLEPKGERSAVTLVIDGVAYPGPRMPKPEGLAVTHIMKLFSGLEVKEKTPQAGGIKAKLGEDNYELYVKTSPAEGGGEKLIIRSQNAKEKLETPKDVGITDDLKGKLREMCKRKGIFVVTGPASSGTTTLSYVVMRTLDAYTNQIFTINDTGGRRLDNITPFKANEGDSLSKTIERLLRVDADIFMVEPLTKAEDVKAYFNEFRERASIVGELPAKDGIAAIGQLVKMVGDAKVVSEGLNGVLSQKLVRTLCTECRQAYKPNAAFLKKAGLPENVKVLYRKPKAVENEKGEEEEPDDCEACGNVGYKGRAAMFELIEMTDEVRQAIAADADPAALRQAIRSGKMLNLQQDGLRLVAEGKTSLEELQRVFKTPT